MKFIKDFYFEILHLAGGDQSISLISSTFLFILLVVLLSAMLTNESPDRDQTNMETPPLGFDSFLEFFRLFFCPTGPQCFLNIRRERGLPVYRAPVPFGFSNIFIVTEYEIARSVLLHPKTKKWDTLITQFIEDTSHGGTNLTIAEGHRWKHVRKSTSPAFSSQNIKIIEKVISSVVEKWVREEFEPRAKDGKAIDILEEMKKITATVICKAAFDYNLSEAERKQLVHNLWTSFHEFGLKPGTNFFRAVPYVRTIFPGIHKAKRAAKSLYEHCEVMLESYRAKSKKKPNMIIDMIIEDSEYLDDGERLRDIMAYLIAGFDTTANAISFVLLELAKHPEEQTKLRKSLRMCKSNQEARSCSTLRKIRKEILRMHPSIAIGSVRKIGDDILLPSSPGSRQMFIPSSSIVITCNYAIHRDSNVFENPDDFVPNRWDNATDEMNMSMLGFSLGRRNCQGQGLAIAEINEVIIKLIANFEFFIKEEGVAQNLILYKPVGTSLLARRVEHNNQANTLL